MIRTEPRRLTRTIREIGVPFQLLVAETPVATFSDDTIQSISISHGGTDEAPGVEPSTCEMTVTGNRGLLSGESLHVLLTQAAADVLAAHTGTVTAAQIQDRFTGRIGRQANHDQPRRPSATISAASWTAQLSRMKTTYNLTAGMPVGTALSYLCVHPDLPDLTIGTAGPWDVLAEAIPEATHRDTISKLTADLGILIRHKRDGSISAWSLPYRLAYAQNSVGQTYPLTRHQVLAPATWEQPNEHLRPRYRGRWIGPDGAIIERLHGGTGTTLIEDIDWTYVKQQTEGLEINWRAVNRRADAREFTLPQVKVDLLALLRSENPYDRGQAGHMLALTVGDAVHHSGDWRPEIDGIQIVTGIDERITGTEWTLTLSLAPYARVFGEVSPQVPAMVWDSATYPWDDESRTWNL